MSASKHQPAREPQQETRSREPDASRPSLTPHSSALTSRSSALTSRPSPSRIDQLLPQTQCRQCGYDGCRPYAEALSRGEVGIDRCPPGGDAGARALAQLLGVPAVPYDRSRGQHQPGLVAEVIEADCIGCTKCIQACPVDAIIGASKYMHVVLEPLCTGCELCIPACPVDCIRMIATDTV